MMRRMFRVSIALAMVAAVQAMAPSARAQAVVVTAKSAGELLEDLRFLILSMATDEQSAQPALQALDQFKAPGTLNGLDRTRPLGAFADIPQQPGQPPSLVAFIPITDGNALLQTLAQLNFAVSDQAGAPGFSHRVMPPGNGAPPLYVVMTKTYAFFSIAPTGADKLKNLMPASLIPKGPPADIAARVRIDLIPEPLKQQALANAQERSKADRERRPDETDAAYKGRMMGLDFSLELSKQLATQGRELALSIVIDPKRKEFAVEAGLSGMPGTDLDKALKGVGSKRSMFRSLGKGTAVTMWANVPIAEPLRKVLGDALESARTEAEQKADTPDAKRTVNAFADALKPTLTANDVDLGVSMFGPYPKANADPTYVLLMGMKVADGQRLEKVFRDMVAKADKDDKARFALDSAKAADGTAIHRFKPDADEKLQGYGDASVFVAFRKDAAIATVGENGLAVIKQALAATRQPAAATSAPAEAEAAISKLVPLIAANNKERGNDQQIADKVFKGSDASKDKVRLSLRGEGDGLRLRLTVDAPALQYFAQVGAQQNAAKGGAK